MENDNFQNFSFSWWEALLFIYWYIVPSEQILIGNESFSKKKTCALCSNSTYGLFNARCVVLAPVPGNKCSSLFQLFYLFVVNMNLILWRKKVVVEIYDLCGVICLNCILKYFKFQFIAFSEFNNRRSTMYYIRMVCRISSQM